MQHLSPSMTSPLPKDDASIREKSTTVLAACKLMLFGFTTGSTKLKSSLHSFICTNAGEGKLKAFRTSGLCKHVALCTTHTHTHTHTHTEYISTLSRDTDAVLATQSAWLFDPKPAQTTLSLVYTAHTPESTRACITKEASVEAAAKVTGLSWLLAPQ
jgi:hypothetical protein